MKEPSFFSMAGLTIGCLIGMLIGFFGFTQKMVDTYIGIGKSQVSWRIDDVQLETCAKHLQDNSFDSDRQMKACAYFIEKAISALE